MSGNKVTDIAAAQQADKQEWQVTTIPPVLNERDQDEMQHLRAQVAEIERDAKERAKPFFERMVEIQSRYAPRYVMMPKG